jgi:hypothetical protein
MARFDERDNPYRSAIRINELNCFRHLGLFSPLFSINISTFMLIGKMCKKNRRLRKPPIHRHHVQSLLVIT